MESGKTSKSRSRERRESSQSPNRRQEQVFSRETGRPETRYNNSYQIPFGQCRRKEGAANVICILCTGELHIIAPRSELFWRRLHCSHGTPAKLGCHGCVSVMRPIGGLSLQDPTCQVIQSSGWTGVLGNRFGEMVGCAVCTYRAVIAIGHICVQKHLAQWGNSSIDKSRPGTFTFTTIVTVGSFASFTSTPTGIFIYFRVPPSLGHSPSAMHRMTCLSAKDQKTSSPDFLMQGGSKIIEIWVDRCLSFGARISNLLPRTVGPVSE